MTYTKCSAFSEQDGPSAHCLWGYKIPGQGQECFRCEEGWVNVSGGCEQLGGAGTKWEGCLATNVSAKVCGLCDAWNGYTMPSDNGVCVKSSTPVANQSGQLKDLFKMGIRPSEAEYLKELLISISEGVAEAL